MQLPPRPTHQDVCVVKFYFVCKLHNYFVIARNIRTFSFLHNIPNTFKVGTFYNNFYQKCGLFYKTVRNLKKPMKISFLGL